MKNTFKKYPYFAPISLLYGAEGARNTRKMHGKCTKNGLETGTCNSREELLQMATAMTWRQIWCILVYFGVFYVQRPCDIWLYTCTVIPGAVDAIAWCVISYHQSWLVILWRSWWYLRLGLKVRPQVLANKVAAVADFSGGGWDQVSKFCPKLA